MSRSRWSRRCSWLATGNALLVLYCVASGIQAAEPDSASVLVLEGTIDAAMEQRFYSAIATGAFDTVRITSPGSNGGRNPRLFRPALRIAEVMRIRGMNVTVRGLCAESCANYIFVAGRHRHVEPGSLVAFGGSATALHDLQATLGADLFPQDFVPMFSALGNFAAAEREFFQLRGVPVSLLKDSSVARQPHCVIFYRNGSSAHSFTANLNYRMWVPSREYLASNHVPFDGYWPASRREMTRIARKLLERGADRFVRFAAEDHLRGRRKANYRIEDLGDCVLEEVVPGPASAPQE